MDLLFATEPSWALLLIRLALGAVFFAHGAQKVFGWFGGYGLKGTVGYFQSLGIPPALGVIGCFTELLGGVAVFIGLLTRLAALGLAVQMLVAIAKVHWPHGFFMNHGLQPGKKHGIEFVFALLAMALALLVGGAGAVSVDLALVAR